VNARLALLGICALLAGCGSDDAEPAPEPSADEKAAADMALRYLEAVVDKDWEAVCETRSPSERKEFARMAGSCERMYKVIFKDKPTELFDGSEAGEVRIEGDIAGVDIHQSGQKKPVTTLAVVRTDGGWYLEDTSEAETP
jgi:hypothetical protein